MVAAYKSERTLSRFLESLRGQTFRDREVILIDSSPSSACQELVRGSFPEVVYRRFATQLSAFEARNRGVRLARGQLLVFTDPDAYPQPDWLQALVDCYRESKACVIGAVACYGDNWLDRGAHLVKFDKWLPSETSRLLTEGPTVNFLIPRDVFDSLGPFSEGSAHADTELSWRLRRAGVQLRFAPAAIVEHHHLQGWTDLIAERFTRGVGYAELESKWDGNSRPSMAWRLLISLLPLRLLSQLRRVRGHARAAGQEGDFFGAFPVVATALYAGLLGECVYFTRSILSRS